MQIGDSRSMTGKPMIDDSLLHSIRTSIVDAMPIFPKKLIGMNQIVRDAGMPFSHIQVLIMLRKESMSIGELSRCLAIAKPNVTPLIDELSVARYVERIRDDKDRRVVKVHLLPAGEEKINAIERMTGERILPWTERLSKSEIRELNRSLQSLIRIISLIPDDAN